MPRINKGLYMGTIIGAHAAGLVFAMFSFATMFSNDQSMKVLNVLNSLVAVVLIIFSFVMAAILVYKSWESIQDKGARATPGKAVGFLFIPFFNFYWFFQAFWGWAQDFNRHIDGAGTGMEKMPEGLILAFTIVLLLSLVPIPFLGFIFRIAAVIMLGIFLGKVIDSVNTINGHPVEPLRA